jgi:hypothetical protein
LRADLIVGADVAARVRALLKDYVNQRVSYYLADDEAQIRQSQARISDLQKQLWDAVVGTAAVERTAVQAITIVGMNDVLNSQGYTQASWWNRIPTSAWILMTAIALISNALLGYGSRNIKSERMLLMVLPLIVALSFLLIADIDSPRSGIIRVKPQNLMALADSMRAR